MLGEPDWSGLPDIVLAVCQVVFALALVPMLFKRAPLPPLTTCVATTVAMFATASALFTLELDFSASCATITCCLWFVITVKAILAPWGEYAG